jgi:hypothetical protein
MNEFLKKYNIQFSTSSEFAKPNRIIFSDTLLSQFIGDHYRMLPEANQLVNGIESVANGNSRKFETCTQSLQLIVVDASTTNIYEDVDSYENDNYATPEYALPTNDFLVIVRAWRDYLKLSLLKAADIT